MPARGKGEQVEDEGRRPVELVSRAKDLRPSDPTRLGSWTLAGRLAIGGQGVTYTGTFDNKTAVIKWFHASSLPIRVLREARLLASLKHLSGIPPMYDSGEEHGRAWIAMEKINGVPLYEWRAHQGSVSLDTWDLLLIDIASNLSRLHARGIVHRDLSSGNILIDVNERAWIIDFGYGYSDDDERITTTMAVGGTPVFIAPEQLDVGMRNVTSAADMYALGVIALALIAGELPRVTMATLINSPAIMRKLASEKLTGWRRDLILSCLSDNPTDRPTAATATSTLVTHAMREATAEMSSTWEKQLAATALREARRTDLAITIWPKEHHDTIYQEVLLDAYKDSLVHTGHPPASQFHPHRPDMDQRDLEGWLTYQAIAMKARLDYPRRPLIDQATNGAISCLECQRAALAAIVKSTLTYDDSPISWESIWDTIWDLSPAAFRPAFSSVTRMVYRPILDGTGERFRNWVARHPVLGPLAPNEDDPSTNRVNTYLNTLAPLHTHSDLNSMRLFVQKSRPITRLAEHATTTAADSGIDAALTLIEQCDDPELATRATQRLLDQRFNESPLTHTAIPGLLPALATRPPIHGYTPNCLPNYLEDEHRPIALAAIREVDALPHTHPWWQAWRALHPVETPNTAPGGNNPDGTPAHPWDRIRQISARLR